MDAFWPVLSAVTAAAAINHAWVLGRGRGRGRQNHYSARCYRERARLSVLDGTQVDCDEHAISYLYTCYERQAHATLLLLGKLVECTNDVGYSERG